MVLRRLINFHKRFKTGSQSEYDKLPTSNELVDDKKCKDLSHYDKNPINAEPVPFPENLHSYPLGHPVTRCKLKNGSAQIQLSIARDRIDEIERVIRAKRNNRLVPRDRSEKSICILCLGDQSLAPGVWKVPTIFHLQAWNLETTTFFSRQNPTTLKVTLKGAVYTSDTERRDGT